MKKQIHIEGMSCEHCVRHVAEALRAIDGVNRASVHLKDKNAIVELNKEVADSVIRNAIEEAGYDVVSIAEL